VSCPLCTSQPPIGVFEIRIGAIAVGCNVVTWSARSDRLDDDALLAAIALGDQSACTVFVRRHQRRVYGLAFTMCRDPQLAEDVAQQTFERAWRHAASFDPRKASVTTWLLTICRRLAIDVLRARRPTPTAGEDLDALLPASPVDGVELTASTSVEVRELHAAFGRLPAEQRRAVLLAALVGHTANEIAAIEDIPLGTAKTRLRLGMRRLRSDLVPVSPLEVDRG
jgi:RNA polymerase sigma-70 factor (ECF subfamily)